MNTYLEYTYSIKRFTHENDDYLNALKIYNDTIPFEIRTDTNEITYWLNNKSNSFDMNVFGLYLNNELIGFALNTYIPRTKIVNADYLTVLEPFRINTLILNYLGLIHNFYKENGYDVSFFVMEISNKNQGRSINKESMSSIKILCLEDYVKADILYIEPQLGLNNSESEFEAFLYLKSIDTPNIINTTTYLEIVKSIYYDYYLEWYRPMLNYNELEIYKTKLNNLYTKITEHTKTKNNIMLIKSNCKEFHCNTSSREMTSANIPAISQKNNKNYFWLIVGFLGVPILTAIWIKILIFLGFDMNTATSLYSTIIPVLISGIFSVIITLKSS